MNGRPGAETRRGEESALPGGVRDTPSREVPDAAPRAWRAALAVLARLPQGAMSAAFGRVADVRIPRWLRRPVLGSFARLTGAAVEEAEMPLPEYESLNAFFVRRLRPGVRRWPDSPTVLASPVDGIVGQLGEVRGGQALQAKGRWYRIAELLADDEDAARFEGGGYITIYLSPRHYHRIHTPCPGRIPKGVHVPGALLPVNAAAVAHVPDLFARNERRIVFLDSAFGRLAVVAVGAYNVGRISAAFDPAWRPDRRTVARTGRALDEPEIRCYDPPVPVGAGCEIMAFHLGSTVILLHEPGAVRLRPDLRPGVEVQVGQPLSS